MIIVLDTEKAFEKNTSLHDIGLGESRETRNIPKHNKGNIQQSNSQHQTKWRETQSNPTEINKTKLSTLFISIKYSS